MIRQALVYIWTLLVFTLCTLPLFINKKSFYTKHTHSIWFNYNTYLSKALHPNIILLIWLPNLPLTTQTHFTYYHTNLPYVHNHHASPQHQKPPPIIQTMNSLYNQSIYTTLFHNLTSHTPILQYPSNIQIFPVHTPTNHTYTHPHILHSYNHHTPQPQKLPKYETNHNKSTKSTYTTYERSHNIFNTRVSHTNNNKTLHTNILPPLNKIYFVTSLLTSTPSPTAHTYNHFYIPRIHNTLIQDITNNMIPSTHTCTQIDSTTPLRTFTQNMLIMLYNTNNPIFPPLQNTFNNPHINKSHHYHNQQLQPHIKHSNHFDNGTIYTPTIHKHISNLHNMYDVHIHLTNIIMSPVNTLIYISNLYHVTHTTHIILTPTHPEPNQHTSTHITHNTITITLTYKKMASAYRPRHTNHNTYRLIYNWKPNSITNQTPMHKTNFHFSPKQVENTIPAIPNFFTTTQRTIVIYPKTHKKKPKILYSTGHYFIHTLELLKCGDIEPNPGPMPNILHTHPATHKKELTYTLLPTL